MSDKWKKKIKQYLIVALGVFLLDLGFYFFIEPSKLVLGGMMGLSIIFEPYYSQIGSWFTPSIFLLIGNVITLIIGGIMLGKDFFLKTIFSSMFSPLVVFIFEQTCDPNFFMSNVSTGGYYIVAIAFGALLSGLGLGIALKNNGSTGGVDVIQKIMSRYLHIPYSITMYLTDWVIVIFSAVSFSNGFSYNIEMAMYGIIGVLVISVIIDSIIMNAKRRKTVHIVSNKYEEIKEMIYRTIDRGVTFVSVTGAYSKEDKTMIICTMDKREAYKVTQAISEIDPEAFCYVTSTGQIVGEYLRKNDSKKFKEK